MFVLNRSQKAMSFVFNGLRFCILFAYRIFIQLQAFDFRQLFHTAKMPVPDSAGPGRGPRGLRPRPPIGYPDLDPAGSGAPIAHQAFARLPPFMHHPWKPSPPRAPGSAKRPSWVWIYTENTWVTLSLPFFPTSLPVPAAHWPHMGQVSF